MCDTCDGRDGYAQSGDGWVAVEVQSGPGTGRAHRAAHQPGDGRQEAGGDDPGATDRVEDRFDGRDGVALCEVIVEELPARQVAGPPAAQRPAPW